MFATHIWNTMITVILPNYNHARFLPARLDSILQQTYQDFELIILDDCSSDNSCELIENYRNHPKVSHIIYNEENSGSTFRQWERGLALAQGKYVWIAESDDLCESTLLEELVTAIEINTGVVAYSRIRYIDQDGKFLDNPSSTDKTICYEPNEFISQKMAIGNVIYNASCSLFKREVALSLPKDYMKFKAAGDYLFWVMMAQHGRVVFVDKVLDYCRTHGTNVTTKAQASGLTYQEDYKVFQYMTGAGLLSFQDRLRSKIYHLEQILLQKFDREGTRKELLMLWDPTTFLRNNVIRAICWIFLKN